MFFKTKNEPSHSFQPSFKLAFQLLLLSRIFAAYYSNIQGIIQCIHILFNEIDCDEVFNYWEPLHYLQYGIGQQTWEYSPEFAIRSWAYILPHAILAQGFELFITTHKIKLFYLIRLFFGGVSAWIDALLYDSVKKNVHPKVGIYTLIFLIFSPGMFISSTSFLPSTFAMYFTTLAFVFGLQSEITRKSAWNIVFCVGTGSLLGWPFAGALALPFICHIGMTRQKLRQIRWMFEASLLVLFGLLLPMVMIDYVFYKKWTIVPLNIVLYNIFSGPGRGPDIYGTEPFYFYIFNCLLNFNFAFLFALSSLPMLILSFTMDKKRLLNVFPVMFVLSFFYIWFMIFTLQPHKEERFMYVVYPILCVNGGISLYLFKEWAGVWIHVS